jgi:hypothetical protein
VEKTLETKIQSGQIALVLSEVSKSYAPNGKYLRKNGRRIFKSELRILFALFQKAQALFGKKYQNYQVFFFLKWSKRHQESQSLVSVTKTKIKSLYKVVKNLNEVHNHQFSFFSFSRKLFFEYFSVFQYIFS